MTIGRAVLDIQYFGALGLQVIIAIAMIWRRLYLQARFFFAYIVWQTFSVACLYEINFKLPSYYYFYAYWVNDVVDIVMAVAILVEVFNRIFAPYEGIRGVARIAFVVSAAIVGAASAIFLLFHHAEHSVPVLTFALVAERSVRILQLGLILSLFAITRYLHLRWKNYLFGIALGFGFYAMTTLAVLVIRMAYGEPVIIITNVLWGTGYCVAVLIWATYVLQPEAAKIPIVSLPSHQLEEWDETLKNILSRKR